jgi:predicted GNAT superfamily acetyltransferase
MDPGQAIEVGEARPSELIDGTRLLAEALGFPARDAVPAWLAQDAAEAGAIVLAARADGRLVGFSLALPAFTGAERSYISCGLAVDPGHRSRRIGLRLKLAQRDAALARGVRVIRWRADPLNAAGLRLYLDGLGALLVGYRAELYAGVRDDGEVPHDDVDIEWRLDAGAPPAAHGPRVELPWDHAALGRQAAMRWRLGVRSAVRDALAAGSAGVSVERAAGARRAWLRFTAS